MVRRLTNLETIITKLEEDHIMIQLKVKLRKKFVNVYKIKEDENLRNILRE